MDSKRVIIPNGVVGDKTGNLIFEQYGLNYSVSLTTDKCKVLEFLSVEKVVGNTMFLIAKHGTDYSNDDLLALRNLAVYLLSTNTLKEAIQ